MTLEGPLRVLEAEALERIEERVIVDRLFEHGRCPHLHGRHRGLDVGIGADQDCRDRARLSDDPQDLEAREQGQAMIEYDAAGAVQAGLFQQILGVAPAIDLQADGFNQRAQRIAELVIVVDDVYP